MIFASNWSVPLWFLHIQWCVKSDALENNFHKDGGFASQTGPYCYHESIVPMNWSQALDYCQTRFEDCIDENAKVCCCGSGVYMHLKSVPEYLIQFLDRDGYPVKTFRQGWIPCRGDFCRGAGCGGQPCASGVISAFFNSPTLNDIFGPKKSHLPALEFRSGRFWGSIHKFSAKSVGGNGPFWKHVFLPYKISRTKRQK